jgi:dihydrofolate synthase / folylpolyglutamate synthase
LRIDLNSKYEQFLFDLGFFNIKLGLTTIQEMLRRLGNPHFHPRIIHIAGTNGKGSTLASLEKLLLDSGYSTGSTISPHLIRFNERFRICGKAVSDFELETAFERVCQACGINLNLEQSASADGIVQPTFFEFSIAIAFDLFRKHQVDYILLETGMGGRLDATNAIENPLVCILTRIAIDHQQYLGDSIEDITGEKLGIVKENAQVFVARQNDNVMEQVFEFCRKKNVNLNYCPDDFGFEVSRIEGGVDYFSQDVEVGKTVETIVSQTLIGSYQHENTATALAVYKSIVPKEHQLGNGGLNASLQSVDWPGRLEYLDDNKKLLIDGAHNQSGIESLMRFLRDEHSEKRILLAIAWKEDKNLVSFINATGLNSFEVLPVDSKFEAAASVEDIYSQLNERGFKTHLPVSIHELVAGIRTAALPECDLVVVAGSLYLLGEFLSKWKESGRLTHD